MSLFSWPFGPSAPLNVAIECFARDMEDTVIGWKLGSTRWEAKVTVGLWDVVRAYVEQHKFADLVPGRDGVYTLSVHIDSLALSEVRTAGGFREIMRIFRNIRTSPNVVNSTLKSALEDMRELGRQHEQVLFELLRQSARVSMTAGISAERATDAMKTAIVEDVMGS
jgi:hypothetical protein